MDTHITLDAAYLSLLAYPSARSRTFNFVRSRFEFRWFDFMSVQALTAISHEDRRQFVAISGTNEVWDWATNKNLNTVDFGDFEAHEGFCDHADDLGWILSEQGSGLVDGYDTIFCGHSLGGAVAGLLPLTSSIVPNRIITFGAPRFLRSGNAWKYPYSQITERFVAPLDVVPDVPMNVGCRWIYWPVTGWSHCGISYWLNGSDSFKIEHSGCYQIRRRAMRMFKMMATRPSRWFSVAASFHDMESVYLEAIQKAANKEIDHG